MSDTALLQSRLISLYTKYQQAPRYSPTRDTIAGEMATLAARLNNYPLPGTLAPAKPARQRAPRKIRVKRTLRATKRKRAR